MHLARLHVEHQPLEDRLIVDRDVEVANGEHQSVHKNGFNVPDELRRRAGL